MVEVVQVDEIAVLEKAAERVRQSPYWIVPSIADDEKIITMEFAVEAVMDSPAYQEWRKIIEDEIAATTGDGVSDVEAAAREEWWIEIDRYRHMGPFKSKELAIEVRQYVEHVNRMTYAVVTRSATEGTK